MQANMYKLKRFIIFKTKTIIEKFSYRHLKLLLMI